LSSHLYEILQMIPMMCMSYFLWGLAQWF